MGSVSLYLPYTCAQLVAKGQKHDEWSGKSCTTMLPDFNTCRDRIGAYNQVAAYRRQMRAMGMLPQLRIGFADFWTHKTGIEVGGDSILDEAHLPKTAANLRLFLIDWSMGRTGVASDEAIERLLRNVRPHYEGLRGTVLGVGQIQNHRRELEGLYKGLDGITNLSIRLRVPYDGESSITGKSKAILALWGQIPGFDSLTQKNFCEWTHQPLPIRLTHLEHKEERYAPDQFSEMIAELDEWMGHWLTNNYTVFGQGFAALDPALPVGRIVDKIYNWEVEWEPLLYYLRLEEAHRLQVRLTFDQLPRVLGFAPGQLQNPRWWTQVASHMDEDRRKKQDKAKKKNKTAKPSWRIAELDTLRQSVCFVCD